jgi:hypothetical protein
MSARTKVVVVWHDAHDEADGWMHVDDIDDEPCVVETIGWLLPACKDGHVVVAQSMTSDDMINNVIAIPCGMVRSMRVV